jgi:hypothetical protein
VEIITGLRDRPRDNRAQEGGGDGGCCILGTLQRSSCTAISSLLISTHCTDDSPRLDKSTTPGSREIDMSIR